jgi:hypothetical protein
MKHLQILTNLCNALNRFLRKHIVSNSSIICPYQKFECSEYDSGSAKLLTSCKDCVNYNKGIVVSKF